MPSQESLNKKKKLFDKIHEFLNKYKNILVCNIKDLPTDRIQKMRKELREGGTECASGKSTVIMKAMSDYEEKTKKLPPHLTQEIIEKLKKDLAGFQLLIIFSQKDLSELTKVINKYLVEKQAKPGQISPIEVIIPAGPTGMDSSQIEYFQALKIPTKVVKNQLEITSATKILTVGQKISLSEINLMKKFNIKPYKHIVQINHIFLNGKVYDSSILKITPEYMKEKLELGIKNIRSFSLGASFPIKATAPNMVANAFKNICSVSLASNYLISATQAMKEAPKKEESKKKEEKKEEKKKEEKKEEEEEEDIGFGDLF